MYEHVHVMSDTPPMQSIRHKNICIPKSMQWLLYNYVHIQTLLYFMEIITGATNWIVVSTWCWLLDIVLLFNTSVWVCSEVCGKLFILTGGKAEMSNSLSLWYIIKIFTLLDQFDTDQTSGFGVWI